MVNDIILVEQTLEKIIELRKKFEEMFILTIESENGAEVELHDFFNDVSKRASIIKKFEELYGSSDLIYLRNEYISIEQEYVKLIKRVRSELSDYEVDMINISNDIVTSTEITSYIKCLGSALNNYERKNFFKPYTFYLDDLSYRYRGNITESPFLGKGRKLTISIKESQMFHLLGLPTLNNKDDIIVQFFENYCKEHNKEYSEKSFIEFFKDKNGLDKYLNLFLIANTNLDGADKVTYNKFTQINENIEEILKKFIQKSFGKVINFRRVYEFKLIPEIILDYEAKSEGNVTEEYRFRKYTVAFTQLNSNNSILIESCDEVKIENALVNNNYGLSKVEIQEFINILKDKKLLGYTTAIEKPKSGVKNNRIKIYLKNKNNSGFNGEQYNYDVIEKNLISDYPPNTMLLSYNSSEIQAQEVYGYYSIIHTLIYYCYLVAQDYKKSGNSLKIAKNAFLSTNDEMLIKKILLDFNSNKYNIAYNEILILKDLLQSYTNCKNINDDFLASIISFFMMNDIELKNIFKLDIDEKLKKELIDHMIPYLSNIINVEFPMDYIELNKFLKPATIVFDKLREETQIYNNSINLIGYVVKMGDIDKLKNSLDEYEELFTEEVYPKTFGGKTCMQLLYDLRTNGFNYFVNYITSGDEPINIGTIFERTNFNILKEIDIDVELHKYGYYCKSLEKKGL